MTETLLTKAFNEVDTKKTGHIFAKDVETVLNLYNDYPEVTKKLDTSLIKKEVGHFYKTTADKDKIVTLKEFINYYLPLIPHW
jgi:Ca2+-binding EF-hand superfamily protein